ncbi:hypothetical protein M422DRAFT_65985 [Sphaerobolus stellatus SS14]|nr:hypothetical protein M422DRAFT_65985 [Sphaerobolus stellatus SS14]
MADSSTSSPSKPKPGSLRDRIAAFEKSAAAASSTTPSPNPIRPKHGNISWKPQPTSPNPDSPEPAKRHVTSSMSADDAKESVKTGGSLKERMAALQGKGGPGVSPPPLAPGPKPLKREPLVVPRPVDDIESPKEDHEVKSEELRSPDEKHEKETVEEIKQEKEEGGEGEQDEEAKERERRAALAARMARLGGARIGFAPPVFGKKPDSKPKSPVSEEAPPKSISSSAAEDQSPSPSASISTTSPGHEVPKSTPENNESLPEAIEASKEEPSVKATSTSPIIDEKSASKESIPSAHSPPLSMPVPALPRRAAPPRHKNSRSQKSDVSTQETDPEAAPTTEGATDLSKQEAKLEADPTSEGVVSESKAKTLENPASPSEEQEKESQPISDPSPSHDGDAPAQTEEVSVEKEGTATSNEPEEPVSLAEENKSISNVGVTLTNEKVSPPLPEENKLSSPIWSSEVAPPTEKQDSPVSLPEENKSSSPVSSSEVVPPIENEEPITLPVESKLPSLPSSSEVASSNEEQEAPISSDEVKLPEDVAAANKDTIVGKSATSPTTKDEALSSIPLYDDEERE